MERSTIAKAGLFLTGCAVAGNYFIYGSNKSSVVTELDLSLASNNVALVSNEPLVWQEIVVNDKVRFPDTVNRFAEHFWAATTEAIRVAKERGHFPINLTEQEVFNEFILSVRAVATIESHGDPNARGGAGEIGVMQLMPKEGLTFNRGEDESILFDPQVNIYRGSWYYSVLWFNSYKEFGVGADLELVSSLAAARYNGNGDRRLDGSNWSCQTRNYVKHFIEARLRGDFTPGNSCG